MNPEVWSAIQTALDDYVKYLWPMAVALAGVGIATMATLQMVKDLFRLQWYFNRWQVRRWLGQRAGRCHEHDASFAPDAGWAHGELITLATAGDEDAFYSLDCQQIAAQMAAASQIALDYPRRYTDLFLCLVAEAEPADVKRVLGPPPRPAAKDAWIGARNRVGHQVQRTLDGLQISLTNRWKRSNQVVSYMLNVLFVMLALRSLNARLTSMPIVDSMLIALLSGFLAPVAKDLVTALQQLRSRVR